MAGLTQKLGQLFGMTSTSQSGMTSQSGGKRKTKKSWCWI